MSNNEWYTPPKYLQAARDVMGSIDLDPASCEFANGIVKAKRYYNKEDNGLVQDWIADSVWCNPPFLLQRGQGGLFKSAIYAFSQKLLHEYVSGKVKQAILLGMSRTESKWFQPLWDYPICFTDNIVRFIGPSHSKSRPHHMFGTCFVYLGPNEQRFIDIFEQFGPVTRRVSRPKARPYTANLWESEVAL